MKLHSVAPYSGVLVPEPRFNKLLVCCQKNDLYEKRLAEIQPCPEPPSVTNWFWGGAIGGLVTGVLLTVAIKK